MKTSKFITLTLMCVSCLAWKASAQKSGQPRNIGIQKTYEDNVSVHLRSRLDSTILATVNNFNTGFHGLNVTVRSSITFPKGLSENDHVKSLKSSAHILIGNISKREDKLLQKYADKLLRELNHVDRQISPEFASIK